jgi:hypothetical protein
MKRCRSRWNQYRGPVTAIAFTLYLDEVEPPAFLSQTQPHGRCKVVVGKFGQHFVYAVFIYRPDKQAWVRNGALEGTGGAEGLPPWNAKMHDDGSLTLERR